MAYERQVQIAMERLDQSLAKLHTLIKRGQNAEAIRFMEEGELKDRYEELQNIINSIGQSIGISGPSDDVPRLRLIA